MGFSGGSAQRLAAYCPVRRDAIPRGRRGWGVRMAGSSGKDSDIPPRPPADFPWTRTVTTGVPQWAGSGTPVRQVIRHGPGVPVTVPSAQTAPSAQNALTAEQVWRQGLPAGPPPPRRARRIAGTVISVALLAASGVVIFLRLYHGPFGVTGVAVTQQARVGCAVDVTGRISTTGAAGTVSYQWVFQPQFAAPRPLRQSVAAGQSAVYVTAAVEGRGHGTLAQTVTLQVLGPGPGRAAHARVVVTC